jgi:hypothetical protein
MTPHYTLGLEEVPRCPRGGKRTNKTVQAVLDALREGQPGKTFAELTTIARWQAPFTVTVGTNIC